MGIYRIRGYLEGDAGQSGEDVLVVSSPTVEELTGLTKPTFFFLLYLYLPSPARHGQAPPFSLLPSLASAVLQGEESVSLPVWFCFSLIIFFILPVTIC